jgi:hypothetical protein
MAAMTKQEKYIVYIGTAEYVLRVQELLWGLESWPERFRVVLPASKQWTATTMYGSSGREAAERATEFLSRFAGACNRLSHAKAR